MIFTLDNLFSAQDLAIAVSRLHEQDFVDGKQTAGWHAKLVKQNMQLKKDSEQAQVLTNMVRTALLNNALFQVATQPQFIHSLLISRYSCGMSYGSHVDNAFMGQPNPKRSDVSFTVFLTPPNAYQGGELVIEAADGDRTYKLEAGSAIVYPSSTLHHVEEVTEGERLVCVGWVQSRIRDPARREILFDLDTARRSIFKQQGKTIEFDLISKSHSNLLRRWSD